MFSTAYGPTGLAKSLSAQRVAMDRSQRMHDIRAKALSMFQPTGPPDTHTRCIVDSDAADCRDFWSCQIGSTFVSVCKQHHRAHVCRWGDAYCDRCNLSTGVCPITDFPALQRFGSLAAHVSETEPVDDAQILRDYAMAMAIMTQLETASPKLCGPSCPNWWPHPSRRAYVCLVHHRVHHCSEDNPVCSFLANDTDNPDCNACPVSGLTGRSAPVIPSKKKQATRSRRSERTAAGTTIPLTIEWVQACVGAVMSETDSARLKAWAIVFWTILCDGHMTETWTHQSVFNMVIALLTTLPLEHIAVNGVVLIPMQPYLALSVPNKLLNNLNRVVEMRTSRYTSKGHCHVISATMNSPHHATAAINLLYTGFKKLAHEELLALQAKLAGFFPSSNSNPVRPDTVDSLFQAS